MIPVVDRVPTYPNRIKLTYSNGDTQYVTWERADEPTVEGTPLNKALFDSIAADIGLSGGDTDLYVSTAGSDTLNDGSASLPFASITKALSAVPKNLNGCDATIHISAGTYKEVVTLEGYYGGRVVLAGTAGSTAVTVNGIVLEDSNCVSVESSITLTVGTSGIIVGNNSCMDVAGNISVSGAGYGVHADGHAQFFCAGTLTVNNAKTAAVRATGGWVQLTTLAGSGNAIGVSAQRGGLVAYTTKSLTATTATQTAGGGRIFAGAQTGSIAAADLASSSVTTAKIASKAVTADKLDKTYATLNGDGKVTAAQASSSVKEIASANYTLTAEDAGKLLMTRNADAASQAFTITVPDDASNSVFPIGTEIEICRYYPGAVTLVGGSATTLLATGDTTLAYANSKVISDRYGIVVIKKIMSDRWLVKGEIE